MPGTEAKADIHKVSILGKESIHCGFHLIPYIVRTVLKTLPSSTYVLITDTNVAKFHLEAFEKEFGAELASGRWTSTANQRPRFLVHLVPPGEGSKSREGKADIEDFLLINGCTRDSVLLALGGGVIGDVVGFVAATFMRGVRFVQIPTTLLAMVDSSVGGKTAIDTPHGKNLIGAFWQPEYIFIDAAFLETLPPREFSNGMAEVIKTAAIRNEDEFASLESRSAEIFAAIQTSSVLYSGRLIRTRSEAQNILLSVIIGSITVKSDIVTADPHESGLRNLVNFGHTIGHAIEAVFTPSLLHGEAVSVGIILEAEVSRQMGILSQVGVGRLARCLKAYNLPISLSDPRIASLPSAKLLTVDRLLDIMKIDKKNSGPVKKIVLLSKIGATYEDKATAVPDEVIVKALADGAEVIPGTPTKDPVRMVTPGSKSISNRALVLAALGKGTCRLKNLLHSDDTQVMMTALLELKGAQFSWEDGGETLVVQGGEGTLSVPPRGKELYLGNAGTAARFLTTVCALVRSSPEDTAEATIITGNARMKQRPIGPLVTALQANGNDIQFLETQGCLPLSIPPQGLKGSTIQLAASISSQYVSSILLCAPYAEEPVTLELTGGQVISQPYIDMTIAMMKTFGIEVRRRVDEVSGKSLDIYDIPKGTYTNPPIYHIESDASSATYPLAIAAITGTTCTVENIGTSSLQGDARFAKEVLESMGCRVTQTVSETTVQGPAKGGLKGIEVDMEIMTDAFLTATVLAAVAQGKTRITGIANQRVKECNRIKAMMDELAKFGVETIELEDGLEIIGKPPSELKRGVSVHCYDDHRVAMAFSVLGSIIEGTIIEERRCVEKTWPNWWDDLENKIGLKVKGIELASSAGLDTKASGSGKISQRGSDASVILIGMRGSGKTFVGDLAASALSWSCIDADAYFEEKYKIGVRDFVQSKGWPAFREAETAVLEELLQNHPAGHVISLGGGIVESPGARELLKTYAEKNGPVVYIKRDISEIVEYLGVEGARPAYGEPTESVFERRQPWFKGCSSHIFVNHVGSATSLGIAKKEIQDEAARFFNHITGQRPNLAQNVAPGKRSYFVCLTYPDITPALPHMEELTSGVDAIELRVDLLKPDPDGKIPSETYVEDQLAMLRRSTSLPIIYTVRTTSQGGAFPDNAVEDAINLLRLGLRLGVEYLDVEITLPSKRILELIEHKGSSKIIASWHDWTGNTKWNGADVKEKYEIANRFGDIIKLVKKANTIQDNFDLAQFVAKMEARTGAKPFLAINMGREGQMSRVFNTTLTPITHPLLPFKSAPGQLSFAAIQTALHLLGLLPSQRFYLFGTPISHSMSPTLHNTGFQALGLPHTYDLLETATVDDEIKGVLASADFGGASITIPHKLDVIPLLDKLSPAAERIGAVNTILPLADPEKGRILYGDNTDWIGIKDIISGRIPPRDITAALVFGAGGTARAAIYALSTLGVKQIYLYNRTQAKAQELKNAFPDFGVRVLDKLGEWDGDTIPPNVIVSTIPAYNTSLVEGDGQLYLPTGLFAYRNGPGVVLDMAYKPADTPLLTLAKKTSDNWTTVPGLEALLGQGYAQFELFTGRRCPRTIVSKTVWERYLATT